MNKIYLSENYIIIENGGALTALSKGDSVYGESVDSFSLSHNDVSVTSIGFSEVGGFYDKEGEVNYTVETLRSFLRKNTGKDNASEEGANVQLDTSKFQNNLTELDTNVQLAFETVDSLDLGIGGYPAVDTFADLPDASVYVGRTFEVVESTGSWYLFNRKQSGFYRSNGVEWLLRNSIDSLLLDNEFVIRDDSDNTKGISFTVDNLSTENIRKATWQDKDGIVAYKEDIELSWSYLVSNWTVEPTLSTTIVSGDVYDYELDGVTRYRLVPEPYNSTQDAFYSDFDGTNLTNLITTRG